MASGQCTLAERNPLVVCCVSRDDQCTTLLETLKEYDPVLVEAGLITADQFRCHEHDKVAIVELRDFALATPQLRAIRQFREAQFDTIAYAPGSRGWSAAMLAQLLLAGANTVLDSTQANAPEQLQMHVRRCLSDHAESRTQRSALRRQMQELGIVGDSPQTISLFGNVVRISRLCDVPVLICGETGTGKELIARAIHSLDAKRRASPFLPVNCAALSSSLFESELFGHRRGAFTGADRDRRGLIRSSEGGVLFLDEIGELDLSLQAKLLRVLQEGRLIGVGEDRETPFDVRIIAATNESLPDMIARGAFRADLYHRLSVINLNLQPLRERRDDLPALISHFINKHLVLSGTSSVDVSAEFVEALASLTLPGNVRQLENLVRRAMLAKSEHSPLRLGDLPQEVWLELTGQTISEPTVVPALVSEPHNANMIAAEVFRICSAERRTLPHLLEEIERLVLTSAIEALHGDMTKAGDVLGLKPRTLYNKRHKFGIGA